MKRIKIILFASCFLHLPFAMGQWEWLNPVPQGNTLNRVRFVDENTGYAVGDCGTIIKTIDGGETWSNIASFKQKRTLKSLSFINTTKGFAVGYDSDTYPNESVILKTTNGGNTWITQTIDTIETLCDIFFVDNLEGYLIGYYWNDAVGYILKTNDGGETWSTIFTKQTNPGGHVYMHSVYFSSEEKGFVAGRISTGSSYAFILSTNNGGETWSETDYNNYYLHEIFFPSEFTGYAVGSYGYGDFGPGKIFKTSDAGGNWSELMFSPQGYSFRSVYFNNEDTGYIIGKGSAGNSVFKTTDGGENWILQDSLLTVSPNSLCFASSSTGIFAGDYGNIVRTTDAGNTWLCQNSITQQHLSSVHFTDNDNGFIAGGSMSDWTTYTGTILKTNNAGASWTAQHFDQMITSICFLSQDIGYATSLGIGSDTNYIPPIPLIVGSILKTTDGGDTWNQIYNDEIGFDIIHFVDEYNAYLSGVYSASTMTLPVFLKSTDGGYSWENIWSFNLWINAMHFFDANTGLVLAGYSSGSVISKTTDGGVSWTDKLFVGYPCQLSSLCFINDIIGFAVGHYGSNGIIAKTNDGGETWTYEVMYDMLPLNKVFFADANTGYIVGGQGSIYKTTDGGESWIIQESGTENYLSSVFFTNENTGYVVGIVGTILKTTNGGATFLNKPIDENRSKSIHAYPNPFTHQTTLEFTLQQSGYVNLAIYNHLGQLVALLSDETRAAGIHRITWDAAGLPPGLYFCRLNAGSETGTVKIIKTQ